MAQLEADLPAIGKITVVSNVLFSLAGSIGNNGTLHVQEGGRLDGTGMITRAVVCEGGGTLRPGNSSGRWTSLGR